jgi:hypothetical protein
VRSEEEVGALVARGMEGKTMGANYRHEHSSRSHTVVRLVVQAHHQSDSQLKGVTCVAVTAAAAMVLPWSCHGPAIRPAVPTTMANGRPPPVLTDHL